MPGVVVDVEEGKRIAHALGGNKAAILSNHGLLTVGHSVDEAVWWFIAMERCCQAQLLAMAAGGYRVIDDETARLTRNPDRQPACRLVLVPAPLRLDCRPPTRPARGVAKPDLGQNDGEVEQESVVG